MCREAKPCVQRSDTCFCVSKSFVCAGFTAMNTLYNFFSFLLQGKTHSQPTNVETQPAQEFDSLCNQWLTTVFTVPQFPSGTCESDSQKSAGKKGCPGQPTSVSLLQGEPWHCYPHVSRSSSCHASQEPSLGHLCHCSNPRLAGRAVGVPVWPAAVPTPAHTFPAMHPHTTTNLSLQWLSS